MFLKNKPMLVTDEFVFSALAKAWIKTFSQKAV
jgi:hypothetical protein